jgi:hypothetical protein
MQPSNTENETTEMWRAIKQQQAEKRAKNRTNSVVVLDDRKVPYTLKNGGAHVIIDYQPGLRVDFWPGTGLWHARRPVEIKGRGVFNLLRYLDDHAPMVVIVDLSVIEQRVVNWASEAPLASPYAACAPASRVSPHIETTPTGRIKEKPPLAALFQPLPVTEDVPPWDL